MYNVWHERSEAGWEGYGWRGFRCVCMCISKLGKLGETAMQYMNVM